MPFTRETSTTQTEQIHVAISPKYLSHISLVTHYALASTLWLHMFWRNGLIYSMGSFTEHVELLERLKFSRLEASEQAAK